MFSFGSSVFCGKLGARKMRRSEYVRGEEGQREIEQQKIPYHSNWYMKIRLIYSVQHISYGLRYHIYEFNLHLHPHLIENGFHQIHYTNPHIRAIWWRWFAFQKLNPQSNIIANFKYGAKNSLHNLLHSPSLLLSRFSLTIHMRCTLQHWI